MSEEREARNAVFGGGSAAERPYNPAPPSAMQQDLGFEIPTELVPLPSMGKVYPESSPLHNVEAVEIRAMTTREEDILTNRTLITKGPDHLIGSLIQSCLKNKQINVDDLLAGDRTALMVAVRVTGYGADYPGEIVCSNPDCGTKFTNVFRLDQLGIKTLDIDPVVPGVNCFPFILPVTKKVVHFRFLTGHDSKEIALNQQKAKKVGVVAENAVTTQLLYSIVSIDGKEDRGLIARFVQNMPARDSLELRSYITANEPGIEMKQNATCDHCSHEEEVALPMDVTFLWPNLKR